MSMDIHGYNVEENDLSIIIDVMTLGLVADSE